MWQTGLVRLSSLVMQGTSEEPMPGYSYDPAAFAGWIWNRTRATGSQGRAYNYPHQASIYHSMYRILKENDQLTGRQPALWYLEQAASTIKVRPIVGAQVILHVLCQIIIDHVWKDTDQLNAQQPVLRVLEQATLTVNPHNMQINSRPNAISLIYRLNQMGPSPR